MSQYFEAIKVDNSAKALKALVVDDLKINRNLARIMLERNNFEILEAKNGREALDYYNGNQPDVILMDICMPEMDGIEAMKKIRDLSREKAPIPIIAFTSGEHENSKTDLINEGFSEYLKKPFKEQELFDKLSIFFPDVQEDATIRDAELNSTAV